MDFKLLLCLVSFRVLSILVHRNTRRVYLKTNTNTHERQRPAFISTWTTQIFKTYDDHSEQTLSYQEQRNPLAVYQAVYERKKTVGTNGRSCSKDLCPRGFRFGSERIRLFETTRPPGFTKRTAGHRTAIWRNGTRGLSWIGILTQSHREERRIH